MKQFCDNDCNNCQVINSDNSRIVSFVLNGLVEALGIDKVYPIVQAACPNLTCCTDCRIDDFCHIEGCEIVTAAEEKYGKPTAQPLTNAAQNAQSGTSGDPAAAGAAIVGRNGLQERYCRPRQEEKKCSLVNQ